MKKYDTFLTGEYVDLAILTEDFVRKTDWYKWFNDRYLTKLTKQGYFPNTMLKQLKYFKENIGPGKKLKKKIEPGKRLTLGVIIKKSKKFIGIVSLSDIDYFDRNCELSSVFNLRLKQIYSLKYMRESQILMVNHAFYKLNMRRVGAAISDKKLVKLNEKLFGFKVEGIIKERDYIDGKYEDKYILSILRKDWKYGA